MPTFTPTPEQSAIVAEAVNTKDNLIIGALAGAAKTSTLELIAEALPDVNTICLAFNKKIAEEMRLKLPASYTVKTLHALGLSVWQNTIGKRCKVVNKMYKILKETIDALPSDEQEEAWKHSSYILTAVGKLKNAGYIPNSCASLIKCQPLCDNETMRDALDEEISELEYDLLVEISTISFHQSLQGIIDYDDMVMMPSLCKAVYPIFTNILVDETQDLSPLNHMMLKKLYRRRIIAVGDSCQAIYAFRGADEAGMRSVAKLFDCTPLSLSVSFRCPPRIVEHVHWRAPDMTAWEGNPHEGHVETKQFWDFSSIPDNAAIICRNNAPLYALAVKLLKTGRYPNLWGNDLSKGLLTVMKKLGPRNMTQEDAITALAHYENEQAQRVKNISALKDKVDCITIFLTEKETLGKAMDYAENVFQMSGQVHFMTGHKSKGHEFEDVFFLDEDLVTKDGQDPNLRYVICTRSLKNLTYIRSDMYTGDEDA